MMLKKKFIQFLINTFFLIRYFLNFRIYMDIFLRILSLKIKDIITTNLYENHNVQLRHKICLII